MELKNWIVITLMEEWNNGSQKILFRSLPILVAPISASLQFQHWLCRTRKLGSSIPN